MHARACVGQRLGGWASVRWGACPHAPRHVQREKHTMGPGEIREGCMAEVMGGVAPRATDGARVKARLIPP